MTAFALNHVNKIFKVAGDVLSNMSSSTCEVSCLNMSHLKEPQGGEYVNL